MASSTPSAFEGELHCMIREYLDHIGLVDTKICFEAECKKTKKTIDGSNFKKVFKDERAEKLQMEMFKFFDSGMRPEFFQTWDCCISADIREGDSWCQKLEFYLNIYFAVYPLKNGASNEDCESSMSHFRYYLETKGAPLSQTPDFLPYYALPFVPSPRSHESFKELFADTWSSDLRIKVGAFLGEVMKQTTSSSNQPRLVELYHCNDSSAKEVRDDLKISERKLMETERRCNAQAKQLMKFQDDYQKLMGVTAELITALEAAVKGDWVDIDQVLGTCSTRFPEIFNGENDNINFSEPANGNVQNRLSGVQKFKENLQEQSDKVSLMTSLQFDKIKKDLVDGNLRTKLLIIQALRWRITKKCDHEEMIINSYISNDILGCARPSEFRQKIMHNIRSPSEALRQSFARLLNVFASFIAGRTYLSLCPQLLAVLIENIRSEDPDQVTLDMTLGTLQKLSLRRRLQTSMIESDIIDWLITTLEEHVTLSEYSLEYASALLMNLCLRTAGKKCCARYPRRVLSLLISLLDMGQQYTSIIPYVNGSLYSILSVSPIRKEAIRFGLSKVLEMHIEQANPEMKRQYEYIMKQLSNSNGLKKNDSCSDLDDDDDDDEENVDLDPELDRNDLVVAQDGEFSGEKLLSAHYVSQKEDGVKQTFMKQKMNKADENKSNVLNRPSTPKLQTKINKGRISTSGHISNDNIKINLRSTSRISTRSKNLQSPSLHLTDVSSRASPMDNCSSLKDIRSSNISSRNDSLANNSKGSIGIGSNVADEEYLHGMVKKLSLLQSRPSTAESVSFDAQARSSQLNNSFRVDKEATDLVSRVTGKQKHLVEAEKSIAPVNHYPGLNTQEYVAAFSTRPRVLRTPDSTTANSPSRISHSLSPVSASSPAKTTHDKYWSSYDSP